MASIYVEQRPLNYSECGGGSIIEENEHPICSSNLFMRGQLVLRLTFGNSTTFRGFKLERVQDEGNELIVSVLEAGKVPSVYLEGQVASHRGSEGLRQCFMTRLR